MAPFVLVTRRVQRHGRPFPAGCSIPVRVHISTSFPDYRRLALPFPRLRRKFKLFPSAFLRSVFGTVNEKIKRLVNEQKLACLSKNPPTDGSSSYYILRAIANGKVGESPEADASSSTPRLTNAWLYYLRSSKSFISFTKRCTGKLYQRFSIRFEYPNRLHLNWSRNFHEFPWISHGMPEEARFINWNELHLASDGLYRIEPKSACASRLAGKR